MNSLESVCSFGALQNPVGMWLIFLALCCLVERNHLDFG